MKKTYILTLLVALAACSPRVDDIFDDTSIVRLEQNREVVKERLMGAENGWVMQYFVQSNQSYSDPEKHQGYTFMMLFREDGTVTVGAMVDGVYKTETSMWDVINDNSTVLTFNTFNSIFHYYSNPDPELGLWGADGTGLGGDYEFMVLEYNKTENYQLLKGKKRNCYVRMYPLAANQDWEQYFTILDKMDSFLFAENVPWDMYVGDRHLTLYNAKNHEFRAFEAGADTLGGGYYYGFITTEKGIRLCDEEILDAKINSEAFNLSADGKRLVSVSDANAYITVEGSSMFINDVNGGRDWNIDMNSIPNIVSEEIAKLSATLNSVVPNSRVTTLHFSGFSKGKVSLKIYYVAAGDAGKSCDDYYFDVVQEGEYLTLTANGTYSSNSMMYNYGCLDLVEIFNGRYKCELLQGFAPSKGITLMRDDDFVLNMKH